MTMIGAEWGFSFSKPAARKTRAPKLSSKLSPDEALRIMRDVAALSAEKFTEDDIDADAILAAETYVSLYEGSFAYLVEMRSALQRYKSLTTNQARGVLNCLRAEVQREQREQQARDAANECYNASPDLVSEHVLDHGHEPTNEEWNDNSGEPHRAIPNAYYTVVLDDGSHVTLRLFEGRGNLKGKQLASFLRGADNASDYTAFAFVDGHRSTVWKRFREGFERQQTALSVLLNTGSPIDFGKAYALTSGKCCVCNRLLTDPESIEAGIGPICASRF